MTAFTQVLLSSHSFQAMGAARRDPRRGEIPVRSASCGSVVRQTWGSSVEYRLAKIQKYKSKFRTMAANVFHRLPHYQGGNMENEKTTLTVLMVEPGKAPYQAAIGADLKSLQQVVGGYIESIAPYDDPVAIVCNEEGKLEQLPFNRGLRDESGNLYDYIAGNFMIVGLGEEDFTSLPPEYIEKYSQLFAQPEILNIANGKFEVLPDTSFEQQESEEPNMSM